MTELRVTPVGGPGDLAAALAIREVVFIEEAAIDPEFERDALDRSAYHVVAWQGGHAIGTGRLIPGDEIPPGQWGTWARIGRMAVLAKHRKGGVGRKLLAALETQARADGAAGIVLHAQVHARGFYDRLGYAAYGDPFDEAGVAHVRMFKKF